VAHVIAKPRLREFWEHNRDAQKELEDWYKAARKALWTNLADVRMAYPKADQVGRCLIFNICGNKYRLIIRATRNWKRLYVRYVLTHRDYDKRAWLESCSE
jgi:mRNA interferase HigB